ncbi:Transposon Tf2-8 polyprotein [Labeo rohita]|uniref:Gypsy retrotransposon integrase-like protein 1 n=1 Tax=Labeo rohita TaxID=84645 RepID=A0ABQ8L9L9_LABRO|nr:Transposon Tf2-8 polyprotein [Labeo rohita]
MSKFNPPESFNFDRPSEWPTWRQRFARFRTATKLSKEDKEVQISTLIYAMGIEAENIFKSFTFTAEESDDDYDTVLGKFDEYFMPKKNVIHERACFHQRAQRPGEKAECYIRALYELSENCEFGANRNEHIRDRLVVGIRDKELSRKMQLMTDLTLETAVQMTRQAEDVAQQISQQESQSTGSVQEVASRRSSRVAERPWTKEKYRRGSEKRKEDTANECGRCGKTGHKDIRRCPAADTECRKCKRKGHWARMCKSKTVRQVTTKEMSEESFYLGAVSNKSDTEKAKWTVSLKIGDTPVTFNIDTGADVTVMNTVTFGKLNPRARLCHSNIVLNSPGGSLNCIGRFTAKAEHKGRKYTMTVYVVAGETVSNLLGRQTATEMGLVKRIEQVSTVFEGGGTMKTEPVKIHLKEGAVPYAVHTARRVPFPLLPKVKAELRRMEEQGVVERVTLPTDWCAPMVPVMKPNGTSSLLTTFITPEGRYCFKRLPFGISIAPEIFQRKMNELLADMEGVAVYMDDVIVYGKDMTEHDNHLKRVLERMESVGLKLNKDKCVFRKAELSFLGHVVDAQDVRADPEKVRAISDLHEPNNINELRRALGLINYMSKYIPDLATTGGPLYELLKRERAWTWDEPQKNAFSTLKSLLTKAPVLAHYDPAKETAVSADASSYGIGGVLLQKHDNSWKPVAYCSRRLTGSETRYAQIEKEGLAGVWACERFQKYLVGMETFKLITDHKPLIPLINSKDLDTVPVRCQRLLMRLMRFNAKAEFAPGKSLVVADALSRSPLDTTEDFMTAEVSCHVDAVISCLPVSQRKLTEIKMETQKDEQLRTVQSFIIKGWPKYTKSVPNNVQSFYKWKDSLSVSDGLVVLGNRIVIPKTMRHEMLGRIHDGHQGLSKCRARAQEAVWWPGISEDLRRKIETCEFCIENKRAQHKEPLQSTPLPERPWQRIAIDLCMHKGKQYLVVSDYYSRYLEILLLQATTSEHVIQRLKALFARFGIPEQIVSDNGPQFVSEAWRSFCNMYDTQHITSSPHNPQGNGHAERAVQTAKRILKQDDPVVALMSFRATPTSSTGVSPAELLMGRKIRTTLPTLPKNLRPERHGVKDLPVLRPGDSVLLKLDDEAKWKGPATVLAESTTPRSYEIFSEKEGEKRRNRRHLQLLPERVPGITMKTEESSEQSSQKSSEQSLQKSSEQSSQKVQLHADSDLPAENIVRKPNITRSGRLRSIFRAALFRARVCSLYHGVGLFSLIFLRRRGATVSRVLEKRESIVSVTSSSFSELLDMLRNSDKSGRLLRKQSFVVGVMIKNERSTRAREKRKAVVDVNRDVSGNANGRLTGKRNAKAQHSVALAVIE